MKTNLKNILVPVDFKEPSLNAIKYAVNVAKFLKGKIHLVHIIQSEGFLNDLFASSDELVKITEKAKEELEKIGKKIEKEDGIEVDTRVDKGKRYKKILQIAKEIESRFIVLGENHQGGDVEQELGSTVYHVTLKSPIPVITTKGNYQEFGKQIVVPLDLTKQTRRQLYSAIAYGLNYNAKIHLVSVVIGGIKVRDSRIFKKLKQAQKTLIENNVECDIKLFEKSETEPYKRVLEYCKSVHASLIMVMTHQEGYTYDNYIGAFAHHIINQSDIPVLSLTNSSTEFPFSRIYTHLVDPVGILSTEPGSKKRTLKEML